MPGRERSRKRSRSEIVRDILEICRQLAIRTEIVYKANLNFRTVRPYLERLVATGYLQLTISEANRVLYYTTPSGLELIDQLADTESRLRRLWD